MTPVAWWFNLDPVKRAVASIIVVALVGGTVGFNLRTALAVPSWVEANRVRIEENTFWLAAIERAMILHICEERSYRHTAPGFEMHTCFSQLEQQVEAMRRNQQQRESRRQ